VVAIEPFASATSVSGEYVVGAGEVSADLDAMALTLAEFATLRDAVGNDAMLSLPAVTIADGSEIAIADGDRDGLLDTWEQSFAGNLTTLSDPDADPDFDGFSNAQESARDTDPLSWDVVVRVTGASYSTIAFGMKTGALDTLDSYDNELPPGAGNGDGVAYPVAWIPEADASVAGAFNTPARESAWTLLVDAADAEIGLSWNAASFAASLGDSRYAMLAEIDADGNVFGEPVSLRDADLTLTIAKDELKTYMVLVGERHLLTVNAGTGGTALLGDGTTSRYCDPDETVSILATAAAGQTFVNWTGATVADARSATTSVAVTEDTTLQANFGDATVDTDNDGLFDSWELNAFGSLDEDAAGDYDNDGFANGVDTDAASWQLTLNASNGSAIAFGMGWQASAADAAVNAAISLLPAWGSDEMLATQMLAIADEAEWILKVSAPAGADLTLTYDLEADAPVAGKVLEGSRNLLLQQLAADGTADSAVDLVYMDVTKTIAVPAGETRYYKVSFSKRVDVELSLVGSSWNAISFPATPVDASLAGLVVREAGRRTVLPAKGTWCWDAQTQQYASASSDGYEFSALTGYWYYSANAADSTVTVRCKPLTAAQCQVCLKTGWNLTGFNADFAKRDLLPGKTVWGYNSASKTYELVDELKTTKAYWVDCEADETLELK
jgi:hypothetical protein